MKQNLDLITIGRASVDLYGNQVGGRLEDMASFSKYIGGSPTNIAAGAARLGLRSALISRVGDEPMGRFIREQLEREGVNTLGVKTDPTRLTALAILGIRDKDNFPLLFYRENCADMALSEDDIESDFIASARCVCATGTHLSHPNTEAAVLKAISLARENNALTVLDIDYRPTLWGLANHDAGDNRYVASETVTDKLQSTLGLYDMIVGTEEEFHIAGGNTDTLAALKTVRTITPAILVCKRGPLGAVVFAGAIPENIESGETGPNFEIEVFNVLGAGDGFMSGLLKGWLSGEDWPTTLKYANACGALAVSRHGCTPAYPSWTELQHFLNQGIQTPALRKDAALEQIHWSTNRAVDWPELRIFAFDDRTLFSTLSENTANGAERIEEFKHLCLDAALRVANNRKGYGIICDGEFGKDVLFRASGSGLWIGRPVEEPQSRPLRFMDAFEDDPAEISEWPIDHVAKIRCVCHPRDGSGMWRRQLEVLRRLFASTRRNHHELLIEIAHPVDRPVSDYTTAKTIKRIYDSEIFPDWWKLEPSKSFRAWRNISREIELHDKNCRGVIILGQGLNPDDLFDSFSVAAHFDMVKGFAVGRTFFWDTAQEWFSGKLSDEAAVDRMFEHCNEFCTRWNRSLAIGRLGRK